MKNLVVCCDGTWNTPDQKDNGVPVPSNVVRLYNAVSDSDAAGNDQLKYYHPGVGADGSWWERLAGGALGVGLSQNVMSAYQWLGVNYQSGDRIFLFGFSRGAFTARSLAGMIHRCGLLDLTKLDHDDLWKRVETAYAEGYRNKKDPTQWAQDWQFHDANSDVPIHFLGVWDTVGALGIPEDMAILHVLDNPRDYAFHDTQLSDKVLHSRQAVALDEQRASFTPTLWTDAAGNVLTQSEYEDHTLKQLWFPGVHTDVGGGNLEKGLSDCALQWMMEEAQAEGLGLHTAMCNQVAPDPQDVLHDSCTSVFKFLRTQPRSAPLLVPANQNISVHPSALARQANPPIAQSPYRPTVVLQPGQEQQATIFAALHWNATGIYLEAGDYEFTATGQWVDKSIKCGPEGGDGGHFQIGEIMRRVGSLWGEVEKVYKRLTQDEEADFIGTRREENMPWFSLVGAVANGGNPTSSGTPAPHQIFLIGAQCPLTVTRPGYLYCFANDAWHFYGNNRGSVTLTVKRTGQGQLPQ